MPHDRLERLSALARSARGALAAVARAEGMSPEEALECVQDALYLFCSRPEPSAPLFGSRAEPPASTYLACSEAEQARLEHEHAVASLKIMVRNTARNARRKHSRLKQHRPIEVGDEPPAAEWLSVEELVSHAEEVVRLRLCVAELCDIQRAVVTLRLLEERSGEDVAEILGVSRGYVDVLVHRAKASLHLCMRVP